MKPQQVTIEVTFTTHAFFRFRQLTEEQKKIETATVLRVKTADTLWALSVSIFFLSRIGSVLNYRWYSNIKLRRREQYEYQKHTDELTTTTTTTYHTMHANRAIWLYCSFLVGLHRKQVQFMIYSSSLYITVRSVFNLTYLRNWIR